MLVQLVIKDSLHITCGLFAVLWDEVLNSLPDICFAAQFDAFCPAKFKYCLQE